MILKKSRTSDVPASFQTPILAPVVGRQAKPGNPIFRPAGLCAPSSRPRARIATLVGVAAGLRRRQKKVLNFFPTFLKNVATFCKTLTNKS
jgi:hypothetical protein